MIRTGRSVFLCSVLLGLVASASAGAGDAADAGRQRLLEAVARSLPPGEASKTLSPYFVVLAEDADGEQLPLASTWADVVIDGVIARVTLNQVYRNRGQQVIEAVYVFPASTRAAVHAMRMQVGARVIEARIRRAERARREYQRALEEGRTASLLEQMRPNVFQMSVGNIMPGDEIRVELEYSELLVPRDGVYEFVLPTVVGPRYAGREHHDGWVANPYTAEGRAPKYSFGLQALLQSPVGIAKLSCPSHAPVVEFSGQRRARIDLAPGDGGDRDFVLRYRLAGGRIEQGLMLARGREENHFLLMMQPPARVEPRQVTGREYIFVLDVSGSMHGFPLEVAKRLMRGLLGDLGPDDSFNLVLFSGTAYQLAEKSLAATPANLRRALEVIEEQPGSGGTEILRGLRRALALPRRADQARIFVVVTDGYIRVEDEVFKLIRDHLDEASFFAFGIGSAVNRHLIEGIARAGQAEAFVAADEGEAERLSRRFSRYVGEAVLHDIEIEFDGFQAYDLEPSKPAQLFGDRPLVLLGKWRGEPRGRIMVRGEGADGRFERAIDLSEAVDLGPDDTLGLLWARKRIEYLADCLAWLTGEGSELTEEITRLGLRHHLLTKYTSFVAVDTLRRNKNDRCVQVKQPLPLPRGVSNAAVGRVRYAYSSGKLGLLGTRGRGTSGSGHGYGTLSLGGAYGFGGAKASAGLPAGNVVVGGLSHGAVRRKIRKHLPAINRLYRSNLKSNPTLRGKVILRFVIGPDGRVSKVRVAKSDIKDKKFLARLVAIVKKFRFPRPPGGGSITVSYPFVFRP